jgi:hypothetical protein
MTNKQYFYELFCSVHVLFPRFYLSGSFSSLVSVIKLDTKYAGHADPILFHILQ